MTPSAADSEGLLAVVAALHEEVAPLWQRQTRAGVERLGAGRARIGELIGRKAVVAATGDGAIRAGAGVSTLLDRHRIQILVVLGIAGGLSPDLEVGDVIAATVVVDGAGEVGQPDSGLLARVTDQPQVRTGVVYSHTQVAIDGLAKERLWRQGGRRPRMVVDLESAAFARAASARGVPFLVLRAVSDSYQEALPLDFNRFRRADGSSDRLRILGHALLRPSIFPELLQLRDRLRICATRLAQTVEELLQ